MTRLTQCNHSPEHQGSRCEELASCCVRNGHLVIPVCDDCCDELMDKGFKWAGVFIQPDIPPRPFRPHVFDQA